MGEKDRGRGRALVQTEEIRRKDKGKREGHWEGEKRSGEKREDEKEKRRVRGKDGKQQGSLGRDFHIKAKKTGLSKHYTCEQQIGFL